jgi:hypothetical protein
VSQKAKIEQTQPLRGISPAPDTTLISSLRRCRQRITASRDDGKSAWPLRYFQGGNKLHFPFAVKGGCAIFGIESVLLHTDIAMP